DNLHDINIRYGIKNGDKVLFEVAKYIGEYLEDKKLFNFPIGHIKSGDFVLGLNGKREDFNTILELFYLKSSDFMVDDIEVNISGAITDTAFSNNLEHMIENLFEQQEENRIKKVISQKEEINPSDLELYVIDAMKLSSMTIMTQDVYENFSVVIKECFVKLKSSDGKILHPKKYMKVLNRLGLTAEYDFMVLQKSIFNCISKNNTSFAITISPTSLRNSNFLSKTKELINNNPHAKGKIIFILSEIEYYSHIDRYNSILGSLKLLGVKIAIDRVGSLHSSFLYLRDLDIDIIRFDTFYTKDIKNKNYNSIIEGLNVMAHSKGVKTWMKMIENQEIDEFAKNIGIDYKQGKELAELININEDEV
ncbi:MAG: EAL domain-containing protein, partial [Sulfurimonas sp.]|nr:EAL domain-containing protein [Sulfurimonas sp.]